MEIFYCMSSTWVVARVGGGGMLNRLSHRIVNFINNKITIIYSRKSEYVLQSLVIIKFKNTNLTVDSKSTKNTNKLHIFYLLF